MDQLPYDDPSALKQLFMQTMSFKRTDTQMGEKIIAQMIDKDCQRFVSTLVYQIIIPGDENETINQIALIYLQRCLRNKKCRFTLETPTIIKQKMWTLLFNNTNHWIETVLQQILESLYEKFSSVQDVQTDLINIKHRATTVNPGAETTLFLIIQSLLHAPESIKKELTPQFEELAMWLIDAGDQQTQEIITEVRDIKLAIAASNERREIQNFSKKIKALESWLETIIKLVNHELPLDEITQEKIDTLQTKESYKKLPAILQDLLTLNISFENQPGSNDLISMPIDTPEHSEVNTVKEKALQLLTMILEIFEAVNSQVDVTKFDFFQAVKTHLLPSFLDSFDSFLNNTRYRDLFENNEIGEIEEILSQSCNFLCKTAAFKQLYSTTAFSISDLLIRIVLPLLGNPPEEQGRNKDTSSGYINNLFDICFEQRFRERKSVMTSFLNALISNKDHTDEKRSAVELLLKLTEFSISSDLTNSSELAEYEDSHFMTEAQPESRLEICLLALASLHKNLDNDAKKMIGEFVQKHYSYLIDSPTMEIKVNFCLLIACYPENILQYSENQDSAADCFRFILESVNIKDEESTCIIIDAATRTLGILFEKTSLSGFLVPYALDTSRVLTEIFLEDDRQVLLNIILEILANYELQILEQPDFLVDLMKTLTTKIEEGFQSENYKDCERFKIDRFRDLLRSIFKKKPYTLMVQNDLEQVAQLLLTLLSEIHINKRKDTVKHQDLINLIIPLLPAVKNLTQTLLNNISKVLPVVLEITHSFHHLFYSLNDIIRDPTGTAEFNKNSEIVQFLIEIIVKALHQKNSFDRSELICQGALLFQLIFQYVNSLTETQIENILETTCQLLKTTINPLIRVHLIGVILNALYVKFETSQAVLFKLDVSDYFINCLIENPLDFDDFSYCRQVLVIGLTSLLNQPTLSQEIQSRLPEIFNVLISFLQTQQYMMKKTKGDPEKIEKFDYKSDKILLKRFLDNQDIIEEEVTVEADQDQDQNVEENEDEGQEDEGEENDESNIKNKPISKFELQEMVDDDFRTEFKKKNALEFFKREISSLQQNKWGLFQKLVQNISEKKKKFLKNLLEK